MIISILTPNFGNYFSILMESMRRCWDRKCTCNRKKTKQLLQEDYE